MKILVKLGGTLLDVVESRERLTRELAAVAKKVEMVVVHGGGKQMTRFLAERGVESKFVDGLRVTTPEVVDAVLKVFAGTVNHELVASFVKGPEGLIPVLTPAGCRKLIADGVATGGMQAKLNAACDGLAQGVGEVS